MPIEGMQVKPAFKSPWVHLFYSHPLVYIVNMKSLVLYYSLTGSNKALAEDLARRLGADIVGNSEDANIRGMNVPFAAFKALVGLGAKVEDLKYDPAGYDLVVLVSPVWAGGVPPYIKGLLNKVKGKIKSFAIASVSGGGSNPKAIEKMEELAGKKAEFVLELKGIVDKSKKNKMSLPKLNAEDLEKPEYRGRIDSFVEAIRKGG